MIKNKIGLGTVQFGLPYGISNTKGQTSPQEVKNILELAKREGIDLLDSASAYGNAEEILGKNDLQSFRVVSKFLPAAAGKKIEEQLDQTLNNLGKNSLYAYLAHKPLHLLGSPGEWERLQEFQQKEKIQKIGYSLNEPEELERLLDAGLMPDLVQVPYNYFDRRFEDQIVELRKNGCEIHTRSAFLQGLFFKDPEELPEYFQDVKLTIQELQEQKESLAGKLLKFVLERSFIDRVIVGVENSNQLQHNLQSVSAEGKLPELSKVISENILIPSRWPKK
ncbi:aldo/keto reductase [Salinimicrobium sediminilitoris]|uniref:aldo/keto reductase n=1 Tax=Salinimicrobium sediminilitoris TaxID=2876715 RepID=UPI001E5AD684|nr:aldo/keto reductase [Salinimicrobium sediminilitoris]MCC8358756.1 aldo/keto reductase [Salinimicrobium sediminilitoris]